MFHSKQDVDRHVNEVFRNIKSDYQRNLKCYQIAKLYYKFKDYKSAIKYINRYILTNTNSAAALRLLGECYLGINLKVKALDAFKSSLVLNGSQQDLVLKICTLLMDSEVSAVTPRATYWLERAESLCPTNPIVFQLREHLLKSNLDGKQDNGQMEKLILSEISARPADVTVRIRLLNFFVDTKRYKIAYQHALEIEERDTFSNDHRWYDCLCNLVEAYEKANNDLGFGFFIKKILFLERRADLFMQEFQEEVKTLPDCSSALFAFDQSLHSVSKIDVPQEETYFFAEFMKHMRAQLSFHLATLALKRAKKEYGIWPKAFRTASPLLLLATQNTMDFEEPWYNMWAGRNKMEREVKQWNKSATLRVSQAGHVLLAWSQNKGPKFLEKVSQFCGGKWQSNVYQDIFYNKEHQQSTGTSHFINDPFFCNVPMRLLSESELAHFDKESQAAHPDSLHHLVWLGLAYCNANGQLSHDFRCTIVPDLQFTVENLSQCGPETLNQLDVDAFLYASVMCAKSAMPRIVNNDRPSRLPISISEELCSVAQADWWVAVYMTYKNIATGNIADMRLKLRRGIETIRACGQHGLHVKIIVMLAKLFQERAAKNKNSNELNGLEDRAHLYWTAAIPLLEKIEKNQQIREVPNRLFDYRGKDLTPNEVKNHLEDGRLFLACRLMKQGRDEQAIEAFQALKSPYATFYQALIYEKMASEEINHRPESITSENRSQHIILLTRARDAFYLTLDRLRCPSVDPNHPLNGQLQDHLEQIEKQLAMIDPDSTLNRNGDSQSDETDTAPGPLSPDVEENLDASFNVYNTSNFLNAKNHSTSRVLRQNFSDRHQGARFEARPSPERLDAQLRHLVQTNSNGLHAIVEQLKEMKSSMQIELKDLGCVTRDLLAEMKRWNDRLESLSKRGADVIKPEDLFELREEDYEDLSQLSQPYTPYQNYQINRPMTGTQGTSTVTYGTPVPSPVPPVPPVIPTPENPLIPSFYPGTHPVPPIDPSLLLYQTLGYYAPGMPYSENQNVPDYRGTGIQKGAPFAKNAFKAPDTVPASTAITTKPQPPNVVITSSDTLPPFTSTATPAMSVTIPPQHIRGLTPSIAQKPTPGQVHPYQIQMPPQAQLVKESPTEKLNSMIPTSSLTTSPFQTALVSGVKPTPLQQTTPKDVIQTKPPQMNKTSEEYKPVTEENKLFESRGKLSLFDKTWKERGVVLIKILNDKLGKVRIMMLQEQGNVVHADHFITPETILEPLKDSENGWIWAASPKPNEIMGMTPIWQKFRVQFNTLDEAKDFEYAFKEGQKSGKDLSQNGVHKITPPKNLAQGKGKEKLCKTCGARVEGDAEKCAPCEMKEKSGDKTSLGGFTFLSSPIVKPPVLKLNQEKENPKETPKSSPFAEFSFGSTASVTPAKPSEPPKREPFAMTGDMGTNWFASVKPDPNSFKKDSNFTFEGSNSLVFGNQNKPKTTAAKPKKTSSTKADKGEEDEEGDEEFEPTAEFAPVIDLPALVDVKTGEENDKVLFDERAKLLRFVKELKEWKERGVGQMKVLHNEESGKVRLIMRRELVLKVCCNHYLEENMEFKRMTKSDKAITWCAQDYSEGDLKQELFALRFSNPNTMMKFEKIIKDTQAKMKNGRMGGAVVEKAPEKPQDQKPLSELFKPKVGSWECNTCLLRNNAEVKKCASCEAPKPGTEPEVGSPSCECKGPTGLGKGITLPPNQFTFGITPSISTTGSSSASTFSFGSTGFVIGSSTPTTESTGIGKEATILPSQFTFGIPSTTATTTATTTTTASSTASKFSFTTGSTGFTIGANVAQTESAGFGNGITLPNTQFTFSVPLPSAINTTTTTTTTATSISSSFSFTSEATGFPFGNSGASSAMKFTSDKTTKAPPSSTSQFPSAGAVTSTSTPTFSFSMSQPAVSTPNTLPISTPATNFTFTLGTSKPFGNLPQLSVSQSNTPTTKAEGTRFTFKMPKDEQEKVKAILSEGKEKFEFSMRNTKSPDVKTTPSPKGKATEDTGGSEESDEEPGDDNGDHIIVKPIVPLPDKVEVHTGEEDEEVMYEQRAKLFRFTDKEWKERGIGEVKILKHKTTNKLRLLMRREVILKVCLNHYLTPDIEFTPKDEKTWNWTAGDFSEGEVKNLVFAIRFKTPEIAQEFKKAVDNALNKAGSKLEPKEKGKDVTEAMKNFTFAVPVAPKSELLKGPQSSDDDILVVYENKVTPEQREKAMNLRLPPNFYAYLQAPNCPGCRGCDTDDSVVQSPQSAPADTTTTTPAAAPSVTKFENSPWGSLNFSNFDGKVLFDFAGNQAPTKRKRTPETPKLTKEENEEEDEEEVENEEEEDDDDDDDEVGDSEYEENLAEEGEEEEEDYEEGDEDEDDDEDENRNEDEDENYVESGK